MASATHTERPSTLSGDSSVSVVDALVVECFGWVEEQPPSAGLRVLKDWRARLDAAESVLLTRRPGASTPAGQARLADELEISKAEARRRTGRSEAIRQNPELGENLRAGLISAEHIDVLADAERKTPGAASDQNADCCGLCFESGSGSQAG